MKLNEFNKKLDLFEMANVQPKETGLDMIIFVSPGTFYNHGPRIKVSTKYGDKLSGDADFFVLTLEGEVIGDTGEIKNKDIEKIKKFVSLNKKVLKKLWNEEISPYDAVSLFQKV